MGSWTGEADSIFASVYMKWQMLWIKEQDRDIIQKYEQTNKHMVSSITDYTQFNHLLQREGKLQQEWYIKFIKKI